MRVQLTARQQPLPAHLNSYRHFLRFGEAMLDKIAGWRGELRFGRDVVFAPGAEEALSNRTPGGKLLLASHLGDVEACRALAQLQGGQVINALVFSDNARRFKQHHGGDGAAGRDQPDAGDRYRPGDRDAAQREAGAGNDVVAIVGDRIAVTPQRGGEWRVCWSEFMGQPAPFPQGPFILASILRCPVQLISRCASRGNQEYSLRTLRRPADAASRRTPGGVTACH